QRTSLRSEQAKEFVDARCRRFPTRGQIHAPLELSLLSRGQISCGRTPTMNREFAKPWTGQEVNFRLQAYEKCHGIYAGGVAVLEQVDDVHPPIAPLQLTDEYLAISDAIGEFCLRNASSLPGLP